MEYVAADMLIRLPCNCITHLHNYNSVTSLHTVCCNTCACSVHVFISKHCLWCIVRCMYTVTLMSPQSTQQHAVHFDYLLCNSLLPVIS